MSNTLKRFLFLVGLAAAPLEAQTTQPSREEIDACGVLIRSGGCVLFEGGGGSFVLSDYGGFREGDTVRVVGTADRSCVTICPEADGCVRGAVVYDPVVFPCGTPIRVQLDPCSGLSGALLGGSLLGMWIAARPRTTPHRSIR